jgi:hypothetical protein
VIEEQLRTGIPSAVNPFFQASDCFTIPFASTGLLDQLTIDLSLIKEPKLSSTKLTLDLNGSIHHNDFPTDFDLHSPTVPMLSSDGPFVLQLNAYFANNFIRAFLH